MAGHVVRQAMRAKEADASAANSPAAVAQRTTQATNALLPRAFDCIRLMYANQPRAKPMHQVCLCTPMVCRLLKTSVPGGRGARCTGWHGLRGG